MKLVLHIGTEKTGTTSVQETLTASRGFLAKQAVLYPEIFAGRFHIRISAYAMNDSRNDSRKRTLNLTNSKGIPPFRQHVEKQLRAEIEATRPKTVVIVNEHLSRLEHVEEVARVKTLAAQIAEDVEIHLYMRRQDKLLVSMYSTAVKVGAVRNGPFDDLGTGRPQVIFDFYRIRRLWEKVFPTARFVAHVFEQDLMLNGDAVDDFVVSSGIVSQEQLPMLTKVRSNESMSPAGIRLMTDINRKTAAAGIPNPRIGGLVAEMFNGGGFQVSNAEARAALAEFSKANDRYSQAYLGGAKLFREDLDVAHSPAPGSDTIPTYQEMVDLLAEYIIRTRTGKMTKRAR